MIRSFFELAADRSLGWQIGMGGLTVLVAVVLMAFFIVVGVMILDHALAAWADIDQWQKRRRRRRLDTKQVDDALWHQQQKTIRRAKRAIVEAQDDLRRRQELDLATKAGTR